MFLTAFVRAFKHVIKQGEEMRHYNRVMQYMGKELAPYLLYEILPSKKGNNILLLDRNS